MARDDDDREESLSSSAWQNTVEHRKKKENAERKKKEQKQEWRKLQLNVLKQQVQPAHPTKEKEKTLPQGTKSRQEEIEAQILEPNTEAQIDTIVEQGKIEEERKEQSPYERQKNAG